MATQDQMMQTMETVFGECRRLREQGQREYSHDLGNSFRNFEAVGDRLGVSRETVLMVYLLKHLDGICAHVKGYTSQRENVRGRLNDAIVYLCLLRGMIDEQESGVPPANPEWDKITGFLPFGNGTCGHPDNYSAPVIASERDGDAEVYNGHTVYYRTDNEGTCDGVLLKGTDFHRKVKMWKAGFENESDWMEHCCSST